MQGFRESSMIISSIMHKTDLSSRAGSVLDLEALIEEFIQTRLRSFEADTAPDRKTVDAVADKGLERTAREDQVRAWLGYYKVILFFPPDRSRAIAREIVEFADESHPASIGQSHAEIIRECSRLRDRIQPLAPLAPKSKRQREVMSLTSKALWLCYPNDVPIFDDYALRAIQVISKICRIWILPVIEKSDLHGYQYKMRVLDGFLWRLGKPDFEAVAAPAIPA